MPAVTIPATQTSDTAAATALAGWDDYTEYGTPGLGAASTVGSPAVAGPIGYGWLGSHQRATTTDTAGLTLMGVRNYNPTTGTFTGRDAIPGGNDTPYTYPINSTDLDGKRELWKPVWRAIKNRVFRKEHSHFTIRNRRPAIHLFSHRIRIEYGWRGPNAGYHLTIQKRHWYFERDARILWRTYRPRMSHLRRNVRQTARFTGRRSVWEDAFFAELPGGLHSCEEARQKPMWLVLNQRICAAMREGRGREWVLLVAESYGVTNAEMDELVGEVSDVMTDVAIASMSRGDRYRFRSGSLVSDDERISLWADLLAEDLWTDLGRVGDSPVRMPPAVKADLSRRLRGLGPGT